MKWNEKISPHENDQVNVVGSIDIGYGLNFAIYNESGSPTPTLGGVLTKILESKITLKNSATGKQLFTGSLMELAFERLRSVGIGAGTES